MEKNIVQGLWIGESLSKLEQLAIKSFIDHGFEYHLYVYSKVENIPKGVIVKNGNDILDKIKDELIKDIRICQMCHKMKLKKDVPLRTPKLGYDFVCHHCWMSSFNWDDDYW